MPQLYPQIEKKERERERERESDQLNSQGDWEGRVCAASIVVCLTSSELANGGRRSLDLLISKAKPPFRKKTHRFMREAYGSGLVAGPLYFLWALILILLKMKDKIHKEVKELHYKVVSIASSIHVRLYEVYELHFLWANHMNVFYVQAKEEVGHLKADIVRGKEVEHRGTKAYQG